jgi:hypothetical protein
VARRTKKADSAAIGFILFILVPLVLLGKFFDAVGYVFPAVLVASAFAAYIWNKSHQRKKRLFYLGSKYNDPEIVEKIMNGTIWQGQTAEQLRDALGEPAALDDKVLKTKKKEIWKYGHQGANRYNLRVTLENDEVIGWDSRAG